MRNSKGQFIKGIIPHNKGKISTKTRFDVKRNCIECEVPLGNPWATKSGLCRRCSRLGEKHPLWVEFPKYGTIHSWIHRTFGLASRCENKRCPGKSKTFDWALIKGREYQRVFENFMELCRSCHVRYDRGFIKKIN